jgi:hypothetical protein
MATTLICAECEAEMELNTEGNAHLVTLCSKCQKRLMDELAPIGGFPGYRERVPTQRGRLMVWREPKRCKYA